eukprot:PhM_4_TR3442/c0_g1_i1/m.104375
MPNFADFEVHIKRYTVVEGECIVFHIDLTLNNITWTVDRRYREFAAFHEELTKEYTARNLPYLTGQVPPWKKMLEETAWKRMPKLEAYLRDCRDMAHMWSGGKAYRIPCPDDATKALSVVENLYTFLRFEEYSRQAELILSGAVVRRPSHGGDGESGKHHPSILDESADELLWTYSAAENLANSLLDDPNDINNKNASSGTTTPKSDNENVSFLENKSHTAESVWDESNVSASSPRLHAFRAHRVLTEDEMEFLLFQLGRYDDDEDMIKYVVAVKTLNTVVVPSDSAPPFPPHSDTTAMSPPKPRPVMDTVREIGITGQQGKRILETLFFFDTRRSLALNHLVPILVDGRTKHFEGCFAYEDDILAMRTAI